MPAIADWSNSGVALISSRAGLFTLDANLNAVRVPGGNQIGPGWLGFSEGTNPSTGEMVLTGQGGLFLAVDFSAPGTALVAAGNNSKAKFLIQIFA